MNLRILLCNRPQRTTDHEPWSNSGKSKCVQSNSPCTLIQKQLKVADILSVPGKPPAEEDTQH